MAFTPQAPYSELKRVEMFINQAITVEDLRYIAATEGSKIGYKALGRLIAGTMTPEQMKPKEAPNAQESPIQPTRQEIEDAFTKVVEALLTLENFLPPGKKLYNYQVDGVRFLVHREGALLGDEADLWL